MPQTWSAYDIFADTHLNSTGLNLQAVIGEDRLTPSLQADFARAGVTLPQPWSLILFGNGGPGFWRAFRQRQPAGEHPVDAFSRQVVSEFMARRFPGLEYRFLYPGASAVPLQSLGQLVGWHHESPMKVGINAPWGLWYASRALILVEAALPSSPTVCSISPCATCSDKPCIAACPPRALDQAEMRLERCIDFRLQDDSVCRQQCLARWACPVAQEQRYDAEQVQYHYGHSLPHLRQWRDRKC
jgi:epoxyqueuosine reductase